MHDFSYNHFVGTRSIVLQVASIKPFVNDTGCLFGAAGKYANFYHFDDRCEADTALDLLCNAAAQVCEVHITSGFYIDSHGVLAVQMRDANLVLAGNFIKCAQNLLDLAGENVHTLYLDHIIRASSIAIGKSLLETP